MTVESNIDFSGDESSSLSAHGTLQLIVFTVGGEDYGLEIEKVQEVIRMKPIKKLPKTPPFILGVMNLRGNIIPIVGLRQKFGFDSKEHNEFTRIIVVNHSQKLVGMVVDNVNQVVNVGFDSVEKNPEIINSDTKTLVRGVAKAQDRIILLVELDYLLYSIDEISQRED